MTDQRSSAVTADEIVRLINVLRADEGDSVTILCDNPDFNGQPNCAIICNGDWTGWVDKRFAADTVLDALSMAMVERNLPSPRKVIATSNGHHWIERFNLVCCRDCGFVRRADDQNKPCKGPVGVGIRRDLLPPHMRAPAQLQPTPISERDLAGLLANAIFAENLDEMPTQHDEHGPSWCQSDMIDAAREIQQAGFDVIKRPMSSALPSTDSESPHGG